MKARLLRIVLVFVGGIFLTASTADARPWRRGYGDYGRPYVSQPIYRYPPYATYRSYPTYRYWSGYYPYTSYYSPYYAYPPSVVYRPGVYYRY